MMFWRRLRVRTAIVMIRSRSYWMAVAAHTTVLATFLLVWGEGVPTLDGSVFEQLVTIHTISLAVLLPWTAVRSRSISRAAMLRFSAAQLPEPRLPGRRAQPPSRLAIARAGGIAIGLAAVALAGTPMLLLALQISALPLAALVVALVPIAAMIACVAVLATWCELLIANRIAAWLAVAGPTAIVAAMTPADVRTAVFAAGFVAGAAALAGLADRLLRVPTRAMKVKLV